MYLPFHNSEGSSLTPGVSDPCSSVGWLDALKIEKNKKIIHGHGDRLPSFGITSIYRIKNNRERKKKETEHKKARARKRQH